MSKNGSRSATKYFGKTWSPVGTASNPSIFFKSSPASDKKQNKRISKTSKDFAALCNLFNTEDSLQSESLKLFRRLSLKNRLLALSKVNSFKTYCDFANQPFLLKNYLIEKPFLKKRKSKKKKKVKAFLNKSINPRRKSKSHTIAENIDNTTLAKLKQLFRTK